jgi:hypothetical protein
MATRPIQITGSNTSDGSLTLSDHGNTNVDRGDTVAWQIGHNSGVGSISAITKKANSVDIFSTEPQAHGGGSSPNWQGVVSNDAAGGSVYDYSIFWWASSGAGPFEYDPKISVNP